MANAEAAGREPFVASFTRAAAAELAGRAALPRARVGTLHALCYAMLDRPNIAEEHVKDFKGSLSRGSREALDEGDGPTYASEDDRLLGEYNLLRQRMITKDRWPAWVREFAARWEDWKRENDYLDFTDLISVVYDSGLPPPGRLGFFDEAQDMTPLDFALARQWGEHYLDDVVFVGDEDQTIYEWRGATPQGLLDPPLPEGSVRVLGQSYRLPASVHTYATEWIERVARRADKPFAPRAEQGAMIVRAPPDRCRRARRHAGGAIRRRHRASARQLLVHAARHDGGAEAPGRAGASPVAAREGGVEPSGGCHRRLHSRTGAAHARPAGYGAPVDLR